MFWGCRQVNIPPHPGKQYNRARSVLPELFPFIIGKYRPMKYKTANIAILMAKFMTQSMPISQCGSNSQGHHGSLVEEYAGHQKPSAMDFSYKTSP
jgi:hypothetical protein